LGPTGLSEVLSGLGLDDHPQVLVGSSTSDDAGVYLMNDHLALVTTVDFITPAVDDPYVFGQIAAANSLSDIWAMGGEPLTALNLVMFPAKKLDLGVLKEILRGGSDKVKESGAVTIGGHSVEDDEPKYGLSVTGQVSPDRIWKNCTARPGDRLVITKPIGSGVLLNAVRADKYSYETLLEQVVPSMVMLNQKAKQVASNFTIHSATDVTGFGLCGHGLEMARGAGLSLHLNFDQLPIYAGALEMYKKGVTTGSNKDNRALCEPWLQWKKDLSSTQQNLLFDPQTSGGLMFALPEDQAVALVVALNQSGIVDAALIGEFVAGDPGVVLI